MVEGLPEIIGRYRVVALLGQGGMGRVVSARDEATGRDVALKLLEDADPESRYMFERAAKALAGLSHPNVIAVFEHGAAPLPFVACELVDGPTLRTLLDERGFALSSVETANIAYALAQALEHAHAHGVVHRDVKPENVFCARSGRVLLADFGLAKLMGKHATLATNLYGSPAYMAPEQLEGQAASARSDLHALGCTMFEMLTGQPPYDGASVAELQANITRGKRRALPVGVGPEPLMRLIDQLLMTDPRQRPAHARAVGERLRHIIDAFPPEVVTLTTYARVETGRRGAWRKLWPLAAIAATVAALVYYAQLPKASAIPVSVVLYFDGGSELSIDGVPQGTLRSPYRTALLPGRHHIEARRYRTGDDAPRNDTMAADILVVPGGESQFELQ